jgi:uncharacterized protein
MSALIRFPANDIRVDGLEMDLELPNTWLSKALDDTEVRPRGEQSGRLVGRLSRSGNDIVVRARVTAPVELPCVRCLEPTPVDVSTELSLLLQPVSRSELEARGGDEEYEFGAAEADLDVYDGETVVLDDFVREAILLEVPTFPLCREDCPGLQSLSPDREIVDELDPRLAPLSAFRKSDGPTTIEDLIEAAAERGKAMGRKPVLKAHTRSPKKKRGKSGKKNGKN